MDLLTTTASGRLTNDPMLRYTNGGKGVVNFDIAVNRRWKGRDGEWQEETTYLGVTCFAELAENVAESLSKGTRVVVTGRLEIETYTRQNGEERTKPVLIATDVAASLTRATVAVTPNPKAAPVNEGAATTGGEPF